MRSGLLIISIAIFALFSGCTRPPEEEIIPTNTLQQLVTEEPEIGETVETVETEQVEQGYPAPVIATVQPPYPAADQSPVPTLTIIDPSTILDDLESGLGAVTGILLDNNQPRPNAIIYLADVITDEQGREMVASYDRSSSPRSDTDGLGRFVFVNIPPGRYGLILDTVISAYLLHFPIEDRPLLFDIVENELEDIGELDYDNLPIP